MVRLINCSTFLKSLYYPGGANKGDKQKRVIRGHEEDEAMDKQGSGIKAITLRSTSLYAPIYMESGAIRAGSTHAGVSE